MVIERIESQIRTMDPVRAFLAGTCAVEFKPLEQDAACYRCKSKVRRRLGYRRLKRTQRGWVLR
ncbi:MAG TPA: hypothetical protein VEI05_03700 [Burkholderiaceae bacterium]|nr:hypothetical protein [Burkholderiaceae bacterium]